MQGKALGIARVLCQPIKCSTCTPSHLGQ
jgi:hypothetical protein